MDTIVFDLDDVLVKDAFFYVFKEFYKIHFGEELNKEALGTGYYYEKTIFKDDDDAIEKFHQYFLQHDMYDYGVIEEGALDLLKTLSKTHDVCIFTTPILDGKPYESGILFKNKYEFLCTTFPFISPNNFILGRNKSIISSKYMVDDRVDNLTGNIEIKMLYTARHNESISDRELYEKGIFRVSNMEDIRKVVYSDFSNKEILELVNHYLKCVLIEDETIKCKEIQFNLTAGFSGTLTINLNINNNKIKNLEKFKDFMKKRLGVNVKVVGF